MKNNYTDIEDSTEYLDSLDRKDNPCTKVDHRIECAKCGYPLSEAQYPDSNPPLSCNIHDDEALDWIEELETKDQ